MFTFFTADENYMAAQYLTVNVRKTDSTLMVFRIMKLLSHSTCEIFTLYSLSKVSINLTALFER